MVIRGGGGYRPESAIKYDALISGDSSDFCRGCSNAVFQNTSSLIFIYNLISAILKSIAITIFYRDCPQSPYHHRYYRLKLHYNNNPYHFYFVVSNTPGVITC